MIVRLFERKLYPLLPLYLAGRLSPLQRRLVEGMLERSEPARTQLALLRRLKTGLESVQGAAGQPAAWPRLEPETAGESAGWPVARSLQWAAGMALGLFLIVFTWIALPPAVELEWSVSGVPPVGFRVYRAESLTPTAFELVEEISAGEAKTTYGYRDYQFIPGREYIYRIEAIGPNEVTVADESVMGDPSLVLPGQLGLLAASLVSLYGIRVFIERSAGPRTFGMRFRYR